MRTFYQLTVAELSGYSCTVLSNVEKHIGRKIGEYFNLIVGTAQEFHDLVDSSVVEVLNRD